MFKFLLDRLFKIAIFSGVIFLFLLFSCVGIGLLEEIGLISEAVEKSAVIGVESVLFLFFVAGVIAIFIEGGDL